MRISIRNHVSAHPFLQINQDTLLALGGVSLGKTHFYTGFMFPKGFFENTKSISERKIKETCDVFLRCFL